MEKYDSVAMTNLSSDDVMAGDDQENGGTYISVVPLDLTTETSPRGFGGQFHKRVWGCTITEAALGKRGRHLIIRKNWDTHLKYSNAQWGDVTDVTRFTIATAHVSDSGNHVQWAMF
jgi:hypothetical protein